MLGVSPGYIQLPRIPLRGAALEGLSPGETPCKGLCLTCMSSGCSGLGFRLRISPTAHHQRGFNPLPSWGGDRGSLRVGDRMRPQWTEARDPLNPQIRNC